VTTLWEIRIDEINRAVERDQARITHRHGQGASGGKLGGTWPAADTTESPEAYLLDQDREQKKDRAIDGGHVAS
jgi:hypothetical protein